ncbi:hypothetical protein BDY19DRAFT_904737 [Irpex rosettiformis]|uniref:Uncharacterized protein n=1 Tax=Irpex rosettiformis TaxID=378272 RepID=A0ACB8UAM2_9APHY|nr:hypothetical protein BDY19DRAFT_904737 [Irpex rosettiformis]
MASPRLQHLLATLLPSLFFTLTGTVDPVFVFSVAGLVVALVAFLFPLCLMASFYATLAFYYPRVVIFYLPSFVSRSMTAFPRVLVNPLFVVLYASVITVARPFVFRYLEGLMVERILRPQINTQAWQCAQIRWRIASQELKLKGAIEACSATEMSMHELESERLELEEELERIERTLVKVQHLTERRELNIKSDEDEIHSLRLQLAVLKQATQQQQQAAYERKCEELRAARRAHFEALAATQRREEHQTFVHAKKNERLKVQLDSAIQYREATVVAHRTDAGYWKKQQATNEAQYTALQGSLDFAAVEHRIHVEQCNKDRELAQEQLIHQSAILDFTHRAHAKELAATQQLHELQMSALKAKNDLLTNHMISTLATRDTITSSYEAHVEHTKKKLSFHDTQYNALVGSLAFATTEHRIHIEHCERERAQDKSRIEEILDQIAAERAARAELQAEHDGLKSRHALVSEGYADTEAKLKAACRELYLEKQRHHSALVAYRAGQDVSDTLADSLVLQRRPKGHSLLRTVVARSIVQAKLPIKLKDSKPYPDQLTHILPPPTLFDESWLLPQPDFVEGSSSDGSFSAGSIMATSTPCRPSQVCLSKSRSESMLSDMRASSTMGEHQPSDPELSLLLSRSTQSVLPSLPSSGSILARSDMSLASMAETPEPSLAQACYPSPPPSGSTATLELEPSLPPLPSEFLEDNTNFLDDGSSSELSEMAVVSSLGPPTLLLDLPPPLSLPQEFSEDGIHALDEWSESSVRATSTPFVVRAATSRSESLTTSRSSIFSRVSKLFAWDGEREVDGSVLENIRKE